MRGWATHAILSRNTVMCASLGGETDDRPAQEPSREHTLMKPLKRLWQWYRDRRVERQTLKGHRGDEYHRSQGTAPVTGLEQVTRFARRPPVI